MRARNTRILGKDALEALEKTLGTSHLPEMVYGSTLELTHESTGVRLHFNAEDALKEWLEEGLPPLKVAAAAVWEKGHKARFGDEMPKAAKGKTGDAWNDEEETDKYDWTFTTPYRGSVSVDDGAGAGTTGTDASRPTPSLWTDTEQRVDRGMLMERDPILFFDELTLYESELDDNGLMSLTVKVRVMPRCWYVLMRHWMRVDGVLIRLRETRFFHRARDSAGRGIRRGPGERQAGGDLRGSEDEGRAQRAGAVPGRGRGGVGAAGGGWTGGDGVSRPDRLTSINTSENAQHS